MRSTAARQRLISAAPIIFVLLWSTGYLCGRVVRPYVDPLSFSALRFIAVSGVFIALAWYRQSAWPKSATDWWHLSVCGILIQGFFIAGMMVAVNNGLDMGIAALVGGMQPVLTAVLAVVWLHEALTKKQMLGFVLGFFGLAMVLYQTINLGKIPLGSLIISLFAVLGITFGTIYQKKHIVAVDLLSSTAIQFIAASIPVTLLAFILEEGRIDWNGPVIITTIWLVLAQSVGAVLILYAMIRAGAVSKVSSLFYLVPPICALQGYLFFGETLAVMQLIGVVIVSIAVLVIVRQD